MRSGTISLNDTEISWNTGACIPDLFFSVCEISNAVEAFAEMIKIFSGLWCCMVSCNQSIRGSNEANLSVAS